jgi:hypothetical protein
MSSSSAPRVLHVLLRSENFSPEIDIRAMHALSEPPSPSSFLALECITGFYEKVKNVKADVAAVLV